MANGNGFWKKVGVSFTIITVCLGIFAGYCDTKFKANANEKEIVKLDKKVEKGFDRIERKMESFRVEQKAMRTEQMTMWQDQSNKFTQVMVAIEKLKR